ncbi:hypothetical protein [Subtercola boreus]|uniref:HYR domain-containing protein n=1 Tax=Subtercola boreus TaxID=120213 RepID=A0A3E0WG99_9MICO|nr:hypothetical protein [Subtercola boreus]RFA22725.1 hypothetical protein B7R24_03715 [Subtercola boreus]RFA23080.1 hypothetical protein B7R23_03710 [Subtercola boreus]RFA28833.1 hypothetical protein B7R25_03725 [Subtercola boreus]
MSIHGARSAAASAVVLAVVLAVSGCTITGGSSNDGSGGVTGRTGNGGSSTAGVVSPVIVDLGSIDGSTVEVPVDNVVVLDSGDVKVTVWTATVADPKVAEFISGTDDGSAAFNPGLKPLAAGETTVTLTNSDTGNETTFELRVTP